MRHQRLDLNLLHALDALLHEKNVTRAAERLHVTQPAMSGILARLRENFDDPLLVQVGRHMRLTPRAESLTQPVRDIILRINATLDVRPEFDPGSARRHFRIVASDYVVTVLLADALRDIGQHAPGLTFEVIQTHHDMMQDLDQGRIDFVVLPAHLVMAQHPQAVLFEDSYEILACRQHPQLQQGLTLDLYQQLGHVVYLSNPDHSPWFEQWYANTQGVSRQIDISTHAFSLMPLFLTGTQRIATVQSRLAQRAVQTLPLQRLALPFDTPRLTEVLQWHRYRDDDPGMDWVRERLQAAAATLPPPSHPAGGTSPLK